MAALFGFPLFHEIPSSRWRFVRLAALCWGAVAFGVSFFFLGGWALPGESAHALAVFSGADTLSERGYPLLYALCRWLTGFFSSTSPVLVLNTLNALFAAATAACLFPIVYFWADDAMDEENPVRWQRRFPFLAASAALLILITSQGWLLAASHFIPGVWSALILLFSIRLLVSYARSGKAWKLALFSVVYGLGVGESELVLLFVPVMVFLVLTTEWRLWDRTTRYLGVWFVSLVGAYLCSHLIRVLSRPVPFELQAVGSSILNLLRAQVKGWGSFKISAWILVAASGFVWAIITFQIARRALNNTRAIGHLILMVIVTIIGSALFLNAPSTAWRLWLESGAVPVFTLIITAAAGGLLLAAWLAWMSLDEAPAAGLQEVEADRAAGQAQTRNLATRTAACVFFPGMCLVLIVAAGLGISRASREPVDFCDRLADAVLDRLGDRSWFLMQGDFEKHLRLRAVQRGKVLHIINPERWQEKPYLDEIRAAVEADSSLDEVTRLNALTLIQANFMMFVEDFFLAQPSIASRAAVYKLADVWYGARLTPLPECFFFGAAPDLAALKESDPLSEHQAFWREWEAFFTRTPATWEITRAQQENMRRQASLVANNLGVLLTDLRRKEEAFTAYAFARKTSPDNISALINLCELVFSQGLHPEMRRDLEADFDRLIRNTRHGKYSFRGVTANHGHLRNREAIAALGWIWANVAPARSILAALRNAESIEFAGDISPAHPAGTIVAALYERGGELELSEKEYRKQLQKKPDNKLAVSGLTRVVIQRGALDEARAILNAAGASGIARDDLLIDWSMLHIASGKYAEARSGIDRYLTLNQNSPQAWGILGMILLAENNIDRVVNYVLPHLEKVAKEGDLYFVHLLRGHLAQAAKTPAALADARAHYIRAYHIRPAVVQLLEMVLQIDIALQDPKNAEIDALNLLRLRFNHPNANFVIGSLRLSQGHWISAAASLQRAVEAQDHFPEAWNNLAEALVRSGRMEEALAAARRVTELAPDRYASWATLAVVQARAGDLIGARTNLAKAREMPGAETDRRLWFTDAWIAARTGDAAAAEAALKHVLELEEELTSGDKKEIQAVRDAAQAKTP